MSISWEVKGGQVYQRLKNDNLRQRERDGVRAFGSGHVKRNKSLQEMEHSAHAQVQGRIVTEEGSDSTGWLQPRSRVRKTIT